jgi:hypothetical protein
MSSTPSDLSLAESGALALEDAAAALDMAVDPAAFLQALEHNRRVWNAISDIAQRQRWSVPDRRQTQFALGASNKAGGVSDTDVHALVNINRQVSQALANGCDLDKIRERAYFIWESRGRPQGQDIDCWVLAEMEMRQHQN